MKKFRLSALLGTLLILYVLPLCANGGLVSVHDHPHNLSFVQNKGQWHSNVLYRTDLGGLNAAFLEQQSFTYVFFDPTDVAQLHDLSQKSLEEKAAFRLSGHTYKVNFLHSLSTATLETMGKHSDYNNYFIGNAPSKWQSNVPIFDAIKYHQLYQGIDLNVYSSDLNLKYDFIVAANANTEQIKMQYVGADKLILTDGNLVIKTSVGDLIEQRPLAYQIINGQKTIVPCEFVLSSAQVVSFAFPQGYQKNYPLIIDPVLVGATLSGSSSTNYGHCATYDRLGNIYTGAISFSAGYSTNTGSFDVSFNGGGTDIAISKYSPDASSRLYGTYIGSNGSDYPHSLIVDYEDQIHVLGSTDGSNYPTTTGCFQPNFAGSTDIVVSILSETGNSLVASTYMGGSGSDGRNAATNNYGDSYRGEIMIDQFNNTYIACGSSSTNFPVSANAVQPAINPVGGGWDNQPQDGVLFKLNTDLSDLVFSTYLGGAGLDMAFGIRIAEDGTIYVCGTAASNDFPLGPNPGAQATYAGNNDGFLLHLNDDASQILQGTFRGTSSTDHAFFLDIDDRSDRILIYGQTSGNMPITAGTYGQANGTIFVTAYDYNLSAIDYATTIGPQSGLVPVAFMVDGCGYVYMSGYSASPGLPTTSGALFSTGGFYLGVLEPDAVALNYGTYYSANHVDGGTSRFDRNGIVYQGVCSGGGFNTTPTAWATNQSNGWDIGVFKIDFQTPSVNAQSAASPQLTGCVPFTVNFTNVGSSADHFIWYFGDGDSSTLDEPTHTYLEAGTFEVMLLAIDSMSCNIVDTSFLQMVVLENTTNNHTVSHCAIEGPLVINVGVPINGITYLWDNGSTLPHISITEDGNYSVVMTHSNCSQTQNFAVDIIDPAFSLPPDTTICADQFVIDATHPDATSYMWQDGSSNPTFTATQSGTYFIIATIQGCTLSDAMNLTLEEKQDINIPDVNVCDGTSVSLNATLNSPNATYQWNNGEQIANISVTQSGTYSVTITYGTNGDCVDTDEITVVYDNLILNLGDDKNLCPNETTLLDATQSIPNVTYSWNNGSNTPTLIASESGNYIVTVNSTTGCEARDTIQINIAPLLPAINLGDDQTLCLGESIVLTAPTPPSNSSFTWQDGSSTPTYTPTESGIYSLQMTSACDTVRDEVAITFRQLPLIEDPIIMPNAFSPNNDDVNDIFRPLLIGVSGDYEFSIYDRWGQKLFHTTDPTVAWDGTLNGILKEVGVYAWYCRAFVVDCEGEHEVFEKGNVTIIK
jgi:gliding motility-associated-like protein